MDSAKKILIFYASAGHGHEKAARAVLEAVRDRYPQAEVRLADVIALMPPFFGKFYRQSYILQIQYTPWLWGVFYYATDVGWFYALIKGVRRLVNSLNSAGFEKLIAEEKPDVIFSTHFFSTEVASFLKGKGRTAAKLITIVTDYFPHYVWTAKHVDVYAVGLPETRDGLIARGVPQEKIVMTGIPVEKKFFIPSSRAEILGKLGLKTDVFTVLFTSGGVGVGSVEPFLKKLAKSGAAFQVILVCGSNRALYQKLTASQEYPFLRTLGFVDNMNELMAASDLVVGKAGGLTITESFLKGRPVVLLGAIPGQEARNVLCVKSHCAGIEASGPEDAADIVLRLERAPEEMERLKKGVASIARADAAQKIAELARL